MSGDGGGASGTLSATPRLRGSASTGPVPQLFVLLDAEARLSPTLVVPLAAASVVEFKRAAGSERSLVAMGPGLQVLLPDRWMSTRHARLVRRGASFFLEDLGSKNGTKVNGISRSTHTLVDGDLEMGNTLAMFAASVRACGAGPEAPTVPRPEPGPMRRPRPAGLTAEDLEGRSGSRRSCRSAMATSAPSPPPSARIANRSGAG